MNEIYQQPSVQYLPPTVISRYINRWITTSIPTYGQVVAYVINYNNRTGMVSLFMYAPPRYVSQYIQVHHSDLIGISPYYGPIPPRPTRPPYPYPGGPGYWPWLYYQVGSTILGR
ncbi:hypothetical protein [Bacillus sp. JCM 19034]|uniref:hypothetical protein n=1 Tax=Bacillus sp. JCM 19034 TaxID=1481928 RepID=UPI000781A0E4|nr:hypothetical protein [Bacillus sp. JCM 19034]